MTTTRVVREEFYENVDGSRIAFLGPQTVQDARDLYAVLQEEGPSGSSNLENDQVRAILTNLHAGRDLDDAQWGVMRHLTEKYASQLAKLRASPDRNGQDYASVAPLGTGRVIRAKTR